MQAGNTDIVRMARIARVLVQACLENVCVQEYVADPQLNDIWKVESLSRCPIVRVEWEYAAVIGCAGESLAAARNKNWGAFKGVMPLNVNDPVHPSRILYVYSPDCPYNRRIEQRKALKRILGRDHRKLVTLANGQYERPIPDNAGCRRDGLNQALFQDRSGPVLEGG
jgi:hypothetical protein